jgi:MFS family permease
MAAVKPSKSVGTCGVMGTIGFNPIILHGESDVAFDESNLPIHCTRPPPVSIRPPIEAPSVEPSFTRHIWRSGTLTYTAAGLVTLFLLLLWGDFCWSMRDRSVGPMAQWYLKHLDVPNLLFVLLLSTFPAAVGLVLGPIISYKSDRHRGPRGRRIPFLLITTPIAAFGMLGLGFSPLLGPMLHQALGSSSPGEKIATLICFGVFWAAFEFATIAASAVFNGLINDVVPGPLLGRFFGLFRAVSLLDGIIFNRWIFGHVDENYSLIMVVIAIFYGLGFMWICLKIKEGDYPPPPPEPDSIPRPLTGFIGGAQAYFQECFHHHYYIWVFILLTVAALCFMPVNIFSIPYARSLGMNMQSYGQCMALTFAISLVLAYPLGWLADLFHPLRMGIGCLIGYIGVTAWGSFFARDPHSFSVALVLHGVLSGCYGTSAASLGLRLFPKSKYAQFASAAGLMVSTCSMALGPLIGTLIDFTGNRYYHTFTAGCALSLVALAAAGHVHGKFMRLGGPPDYSPPI